MSVVPLSSPFSFSGNDVDLNYEKDSSCVSPLLLDYTLLNSIVDSNHFHQTLELYTLMFNSYSNNQINNYLQNFIKEFLIEYENIQSDDFKQLIQIFQNFNFQSLICSYDQIVEQHQKSYFNSIEKEKEKEEDNNDDDNDESCVKSKSGSSKIIDEEKENCNYASKLSEYNVSRLKIVRLEKRPGEPLGATISRLCENDYRISIARIIHGSIAQDLFSVGDQLLEINNISLQSQYRTLDETVQLIDSLHGTITFLLLPQQQPILNEHGFQNKAFLQNIDDDDQCSSIFVRSLFNYDPSDDIYVPCRELALAFEKNSILEIVNRDDSSWWQAFLMENDQNIRKQQLPGLIPSKQFQEKRLKIVKCLLDEETNFNSKKRSKKKPSKSISQHSTRQKIVTTLSFGIYEAVQWFLPNEKQKRPIVLIGAPHIGRHELRQRLMNSSDLSSLIDVAVPHTTRLKKSDEIDGRDYHFITRQQFEKDIEKNSFVEHGEYEKNLYGTSKSAIETCCHHFNKICILNLLPEGLHSLKYSNLIPFVIYLKAPSTIDQLREYFFVNEQQWNEIQQKSAVIEQNYSHLFDQIISLNDSIDSIFLQLKFLVENVQTKPMWVNKCWFYPKERF